MFIIRIVQIFIFVVMKLFEIFICQPDHSDSSANRRMDLFGAKKAIIKNPSIFYILPKTEYQNYPPEIPEYSSQFIPSVQPNSYVVHQQHGAALQSYGNNGKIGKEWWLALLIGVLPLLIGTIILLP